MWAGILLAELLAAACLAAPVASQEAADTTSPTVTVRVRQVAGSNLYLDIGSLQGVVAGDTVRVVDDGTVTGRLFVVASTEVRSVLAFVGEPFQVEGGDPLTLLLARPVTAPVPDRARVAGPGAAVAEAAASPPARERERAPDAASRQAHGRIALDVSTLRSTTRFGGADPAEVDRTYATPALRVSATVPNAVAGFRFRTSARIAYRYAEGGFSGEALSTRIHLAALERRFDRVPVRMSMGRFYGPTESFSGYWDGLHLRYGGASLGVAAQVGLEPDPFDGRFSTARPKAGVVVDWERRSDGWRWRGDLSGHAVRPTEDAVPNHTFLGLEQSLRAGPIRLDQELRLDRAPDGGWEVGRLRLWGVVALASGVDLRGGVVRRRPWYVLPVDDPLGSVRDRAVVGISTRIGRGRFAVDVSGNRTEGGEDTRGVTTSFATGPVAGLGGAVLTGHASLWDGQDGHALALSPALSLPMGSTRLRLAYRLYRSSYLSRSTTSHGGDASASLPLGPGLLGTVRLYGRWGGGLTSQRLDLGLARIF
ncbi:MAG: hypothetical protein PVI57_16240 [Gemmatimonadota bacterium]|jgi:hypothetical protein